MPSNIVMRSFPRAQRGGRRGMGEVFREQRGGRLEWGLPFTITPG